MLELLFESVDDVFKSLAQKTKIAVKEGRTFGYVQFIHTFGRDIKWNPHIHVLIAEKIMDNNSTIKKYEYFDYKKLRKSFMTVLLKKMGDYLISNGSEEDTSSFFTIKKELYNKYKEGFYAYGPKLKDTSKKSIKNVARYIARYASHPAIAESRILDMDFEDHIITWYYDPHEDDDLDEDDENFKGRQYVTESFDDFIKKLLYHIPDKGFQQIRYYGFYSNKTKIDTSKYKKLYTKIELNKFKSDNKWINKLRNSYNYSPLLCKCGATMVYNIDKSYFKDDGSG